MINYPSANYLELDNYKSPPGSKWHFIKTSHNNKIRLAYWKLDESKGTILLQQGHNEFI